MLVKHPPSDEQRARFVRDCLPAAGLFAGQEWRVATEPFPLSEELARELESLGRVLLQFYRAVNLLYRQSTVGKQPAWVAEWLDLGKPAELIELQRSPAFKNDLPRVIRPDLLLTEDGFSISELDSVPGGIGLTAWLNQTYARAAGVNSPVNSTASDIASAGGIIGGERGMLDGFAGIFGEAPRVHIMISEEAATYRPEMNWVAAELGDGRFQVQGPDFRPEGEGDAVYRFFELFDLANVSAARALFTAAQQKRISLTPPPKTIFEEKMLFALLWNRNLRAFWIRELGGAFLNRLQAAVPCTWLLDPTPLPPHAAIPELNLTDWHQLKALSQKERQLVLKISGFSELAWGARGVHLGSDLSVAEWSSAVDTALASFANSPYVLQRYEKPRTVETQWFDFDSEMVRTMTGRVRLCPYYFVIGDGDAARARLGGVLATICPADKKIIHGMKEAVLAPCRLVSGP